MTRAIRRSRSCRTRAWADRAQRRHDPRARSASRSATIRRRSTRFADAGADVDGNRVRFPRGCAARIVQATGAGDLRPARPQPGATCTIGGDTTVFAPNYGSPFVRDLDDGRRYATLADFQNFVKLAYLSPHLHHSGGTVCEPVDVPVNKRHLDMVYSHIKLQRQGVHGLGHRRERAADCVELARIAFGGDLADRTVMTSLINASSPLVWDASMLAAAEVYAANNQATIITPFILAGAMAPVTLRRRRRPDARRGARRHGLRPAGAPRRPGDLRLVRQLDVDADRARRRSARRSRRSCCTPSPPSPGGSACRSAPAARSPHRSCPTRRPPTRARRRCMPTVMGGVELRAPRRRLARGRAGDRLREVRARRRPAGA